MGKQLISVISTKKVAYLRELQVSFEEDCLHKDVYNILIHLVKAHRINTVSVFNDRWFFPNSVPWAEVEPLAKEKLELISVYNKHPRRFEKDGIVYMVYPSSSPSPKAFPAVKFGKRWF